MASKGKHAKTGGNPDWDRVLQVAQTAALLAASAATWVGPLIQHR
jgi:hypothetical protein